MAAYLLRRLPILFATLLAASLVVFLTVELIPGDPASVMMGLEADPETLAAVRAELGLDRPAPERYLTWLAGMAQGDFGLSYAYRAPIGALIAERLTVSVPLAALALALAALIGIPAGLWAASRRGRAGDMLVMGASQLGVAIPNFWFAMLLTLFFAVTLRWLPSGGFPGWADPVEALRALIMPAVALALPQAAILARVARSALIEALGEEYIRTARAKGLSRAQTLRRHALPNAMIPVLTILGLQFSFLIAGAIIVENVFYLPGLGRLVFQAIGQRDLILVEGVVMVLVLAVVLTAFLVDLAYAWVDPRLRRR